MCDLCRSTERCAYVELHHNVGMLFMRQTHQTAGELCRGCLGRSFRKHQLSNLVLGWWGTISFFLTWYYLFDNTVAFFRAKREIDEAVARAAPREPEVHVEPAVKLAPYAHNVRLRLRGGETVDDVVADLARVHAVPEADARSFVARVGA